MLNTRAPITVPDQIYAKRLLPRHVGLIGVLTGPYTLTKSSVDSFYHDEKELAFDFAKALRKEAELLVKHVDLISIDEPVFSNELPEYATRANSDDNEWTVSSNAPACLRGCLSYHSTIGRYAGGHPLP